MALRKLTFIWIIAWAVGAPPAQAQQTLPPQEPILRIDPGMHTAPIRRIAVDGTCTLLATGSEDKTVRLWRLPEGKLLRTLRPPIGHGDDGKVYAVALAPDGTWVAAGGWTAGGEPTGDWAVYIFETNGGMIVRRLGGVSHRVNHLAVSADGRYLAAVLKHGHGLRVWDTQSWQQVAEDKDYGGEDAYGAAFDRTGVLYTVSYDGKVRRYVPGFQARPTSAMTLGGQRPFSVAVHPSGDSVAVGFEDTTAVEVYVADTLARRFTADTTTATNGNLGRVIWSADGARLYAGGRFGRGAAGDQRVPLLVWDQAGEGRVREHSGPQSTVMHLLACGNGIAMGAQDPAFGLLSRDGSWLAWKEGVQADLRDQRYSFAIAADGRRVLFGLEAGGKSAMLFDLAAEQLTDAPHRPPDLAGPDTTSLPVTDWVNNPNPKLGGAPIALDRLEWSRSLAIAQGRQRFVLGTDWSLRGYDKTGKQLWPPKEVPGTVWAVNIPRDMNISRDSNLVVAAYGDGTIRWHRLSDGQELLALFVHKDRRWVAWTPKGYFTASAGGEGLVGWHVNRGWGQAADFFPVSDFRDQFYRPDIVARVLGDLNEETAIVEANRIAKKLREDEDIRKRQPPVLRILSPADGSAAGGEVKIEFSLRSPSGLPIKRVFAQIDGNMIEGGQMADLPVPGPNRFGHHDEGRAAKREIVGAPQEGGSLRAFPVR
jgi:WD40 repeat protein